VFVQPMSPARQQQHVVSSGTQSPSSQPPQVTSQASQEPSIRSSEVSPSGAGNDSDQAIVSSSDDQSTHDEVRIGQKVFPLSCNRALFQSHFMYKKLKLVLVLNWTRKREC